MIWIVLITIIIALAPVAGQFMKLSSTVTATRQLIGM